MKKQSFHRAALAAVFLLAVLFVALVVIFFPDIQYRFSDAAKVEHYFTAHGVNVMESQSKPYLPVEDVTGQMLAFLAQTRASGNKNLPENAMDIYFPQVQVKSIVSASKEAKLRAPEAFPTEQQLKEGHRVFQAELNGFQGFSMVGIPLPAQFMACAVYPPKGSWDAPDYAFLKAERLDGKVDILPLTMTREAFEAYFNDAMRQIDALRSTAQGKLQ